MKLFRTRYRNRSVESRRLYARYEIAYTIVDFFAALSFLTGSVLFFWPGFETPARWFFVIGSVLFIGKPTIRLMREIQLYRMGHIDTLAKRMSD